MLRSVLLVTLCVALSHGRPGAVTTKLPRRMSTQIHNLFEQMQMEQDTEQQLSNVPGWHDTTWTIVQDWMDSVSNRNPAQPIPEDISSGLKTKIDEIFDQIQDEVDTEYGPELNSWSTRLTDTLQGGWTSYVNRVQPGLGGDWVRPGRGNQQDGERPQGGERPGIGKFPRKGSVGKQTPMMGAGKKDAIPKPVRSNFPRVMRQNLQEVFTALQNEIDAGNDIDMEVWSNKTQNVFNGCWKRIQNMAERMNPNGTDEMSLSWQEQISNLFTGMQTEMDSGAPLDTKAWFTEIYKNAERWWDTYSRLRKPGNPHRDLPEELPSRFADPIHDVFDRMQTAADAGTGLELLPFHDELQEIAQRWYKRFNDHHKGKPGKGSLGKKRPGQMPIEMRQQITDVFTRMREETVADQWEIDVWRNETLAVAQGWWDKVTAAMEKVDLEWIPESWNTSLNDVYQRIQESLAAGDILNIPQWREDVLNASATWLNFDLETLATIGFKSEPEFLVKLQDRLQQHIGHLFDRMQLQFADGLPIDTEEWQAELQDMAFSWGKRILSRQQGGKEGRPGFGGRPDGRPNGKPEGERPNGRPYGRPEGRPYGRPEGRPYGRPEGRPNGRPQGGRPDGRPEGGRPNGRPEDRPYGRPDGRPNGRPEGRPNGRPEGGRPNGRPEDRPYGRPEGGRPNGRPEDRPYGRPEGRPNGRPDGGRPNGRPEDYPHGRPEGRPNGRPEGRPNGRTEGGRPNGRPEGRPNGKPERRPNAKPVGKPIL